MQIGTLKELNVKPGDQVKWLGAKEEAMGIMTVISAHVIPEESGSAFTGEVRAELTEYGRGIFGDAEKFRIVSRATILWGDMTPEEKGALLLAHHEKPGSVEFLYADEWVTSEHLGWLDDTAYRIKPEAVVHEPIWGFYEDEYPIFTNAEGKHSELSVPVTPADLNRLVGMLIARDVEIKQLLTE